MVALSDTRAECRKPQPDVARGRERFGKTRTSSASRNLFVMHLICEILQNMTLLFVLPQVAQATRRASLAFVVKDGNAPPYLATNNSCRKPCFTIIRHRVHSILQKKRKKGALRSLL